MEIMNYSRQLARDMIAEDIFDEMVTEANKQLDKLTKYLKELEQQQDDSSNEKEYLVNSIDEIKKPVPQIKLQKINNNTILELQYPGSIVPKAPSNMRIGTMAQADGSNSSFRFLYK